MSRPVPRLVRYGAPVLLIIASVLFAAADVDQLGNDVQVAGTAIGLVWLIVVIGRDMGMGVGSGRPPVPDPPSGGPSGDAGDERHPPASSA